MHSIYFDDGTLLQHYKTFTYAPAKITVAYFGDTLGGSTTGIADTFSLDAVGRPVALTRFVFPFSGALYWNYVYDAAGQLLYTIQVDPSGGNAPDTTIHAWSGGDMVATTFAGFGDVWNFTYDATMPFRSGDPLHIQGLLETGGIGGTHTHLQQGFITSEGDSIFYGYDFDADGKITKLTTTGTGVAGGSVTTYGY